MEGGREQNYWPGFVDALSNVVLTLVFVLVVFVFALVIASNKVEKRAEEMIQAAHDRVAKGIVITEDQTQEKPNLVMYGTVKITQETGKIVIVFPAGVSDLDEKSKGELDAALEKVKDSFGKKKVVIESYIGRESYSAARRLAYYRAIGLRNYILSKPDKKNVSFVSHISQPKETQNGRVEIIYD